MPRPRGVGVADVLGAADDLAAAGEVGAGQQLRTARRRSSFSLRISATAAAATSRRLWLGISVARPTAMPLTRR